MKARSRAYASPMKSNAMCRLTRPFALVRAAQIATLALACATMLGATGEPDPKLLDPAVTATERESASKNLGFAVPAAPASVKWFGGKAQDPSDGTVTVIQTFSMNQGGRSLMRSVKMSLPSGVRFVPIHMNDDAATAAKNMSSSAPALPVAVDMDGAWLMAMGLPIKPINVVVDVNGTVRYVGVRSDALKKLTTELLAEKADPAKKAKPRPADADAKKI